MKHVGFDAKGCILGGAQALASANACFSVGTEKACSALELSSILLASKAFWLVLTVVTHDLVASEYITNDGSNVLGSTEPARDSKSKPMDGC